MILLDKFKVNACEDCRLIGYNGHSFALAVRKSLKIGQLIISCSDKLLFQQVRFGLLTSAAG